MSQIQNINKSTEFIQKCIKEYRDKLLDTSRKNSLISLKHSERSRQHIRVIDELPNFLYDEFLKGEHLTFRALPEEEHEKEQIPRDEKTPEFLLHLEQAKLTNEGYIKDVDSVDEDEEGALDKIKKIERELRNKIREELKLPVWQEQKTLTNTEVAKKHHLNSSYEMSEPKPKNEKDEERHTDKYIQVLLKPDEMIRKLSGLNSYVRTDMEESGVNTLYVAFGFLECYESNSDKKYVSPLLLLQLEIEKKQSRTGYTYCIKATGEEPEINLPLSERLRDDFGIDLPKFIEEDKPEDYIRKINELIQEASVPQKEKWKIRRFITIGRFRFARLVMFHDLNSKNWPGNTNISTNKIVQNLLAGSSNESSYTHAEDYNIDTPEVEKIVPLLITSADASQHSALVDVMKGKNMAIQGPPGTGKSQTITNIIANTLAKGKSVLFLAEKMAALNVVHERLSKANLGSYCLELHSQKAKKTEVIKSINKRLKLRTEHGKGEYLTSKMQDFKRHKNHITEYINTLNSNFGRQNKSIHDYLWGVRLRQDRIGDLLSIISQCKIPFEQADLSISELNDHNYELQTTVLLKKQVDTESRNGKHPWDFVGNVDLNPLQQGELKLLIKKWRDGLANGLEKIQSELKSLNNTFDLSITNTTQDINAFYDYLNDLIDYDISTLNEDFIADLEDKRKAAALVAFVEHIHIYRSAVKEIQFMRNVSSVIDNIKEIETHALIAKEMEVDNMTALDIQAHVKDLKLWNKNLKTLLSIGKQLGMSENDDLDKFYALVEAPNYIASIPRDYLLFRTNDITDEINASHLKAAADTKERIQANLEDYEQHYDLSRMGKSHEILTHADTLDNTGFFAFCYSSYRQAKKVVTRASRLKIKFCPKKSACILRKIAANKKEQEKIEQDNQLQTICGSSFNGIQTDFKKLLEINRWASSVRKRYASGDEFFRNVRKWFLKGDIEELDSLRDLVNDDRFIALQGKIANMDSNVVLDAFIKKYLEDLMEKIKKLNTLQNQLQNTTSDETVTFTRIFENLPCLQNAKEARDAIDKDIFVKRFFGNAYEGTETNIEDIDRTARFLGDCLAIPELKNSFDLFLNKSFSKTWTNFKDQLKALIDTINDTKSITTEVNDHTNNYWLDINLIDLVEQLSETLNAPDNTLSQWIKFNRHYTKAANTIKGPLLQIYDREKLKFDTLPLAFEYLVYSAIVHEICRRNPVILETSGMSLEQARTKMKKLDSEILKLQQQKLCNQLNAARPLPGNAQGSKKTWTEDPLLRNEITKQRNHIPIRKLMQRAGQSIQKIKPCFLMSPLTVAQYLEPGKFKFDLVVIDEASQMRPEDALGGIARAKQIVVVGDPQQLPPTSFFQSTGKNDDEDEEDFNSDAIMGMALSSFSTCRILNRHYRSQHESLIAFSDYHFYDQRLVLFPSPVRNPDKLGVRLKYVGGTYTYEAAKGGSNMDEVEAIVKAALDFMKKHPGRSLGIATMNQVQQVLIENKMDHAFIQYPHAANYKAEWQGTLEPFFVKSLENVQGDERDAIFISTVYGPDKDGTVMQRFGPINSAGGHRRLNVLFSRAKQNMVIFTSLKPENIKTASSKGTRALKDFLSYAATGLIDKDQQDRKKIPNSDFEIFIKEKLESIDYEVHPQVGVAGYHINLGVKHSKYPDGYLMGIECDGAEYHSSKSARERDVLHPQVLKGLGWHIYRIWSTDWFSNPEQEFEKLKNYIQDLLDKGEFKKDSEKNVIIE